MDEKVKGEKDGLTTVNELTANFLKMQPTLRKVRLKMGQEDVKKCEARWEHIDLPDQAREKLSGLALPIIKHFMDIADSMLGDVDLKLYSEFGEDIAAILLKITRWCFYLGCDYAIQNIDLEEAILLLDAAIYPLEEVANINLEALVQYGKTEKEKGEMQRYGVIGASMTLAEEFFALGTNHLPTSRSISPQEVHAAFMKGYR